LQTPLKIVTFVNGFLANTLKTVTGETVGY